MHSPSSYTRAMTTNSELLKELQAIPNMGNRHRFSVMWKGRRSRSVKVQTSTRMTWRVNCLLERLMIPDAIPRGQRTVVLQH